MHANTVQVGQDLVAEHVSFVNDAHRCDTLFQSTALDFTLDIVKQIIFSKTGVSTQSGSNLPVEIQNRKGGKAVISHFERRGIEGRGPHPRGS